MIGIQEALWRCPFDHLSELPSQVHGILDTDIESLSACWGMHVRRVAGQEHASVPIRRRLPGHIGEPGDPGGAVKTVIRPIEGDERLAELAKGRLVAFADLLFSEHDTHALPVLQFAEAVSALFITA